MLSVISVLPYMAVALFLIGTLYKLRFAIIAPRKLKWQLFPLPKNKKEEVEYIVGEWVSFKMLYNNNRALWLGSYLFHYSMLGLAVWIVLLLLNISLPRLFLVSSILMLSSSVYILALRVFVKNMRAISGFIEYFHIVLFLLIGSACIFAYGFGFEGLRAYAFSVASLKPSAIPAGWLVTVLLAEFFIAYLPFSKMYHIVDKYFTFHVMRWQDPYG